MPTIVSEGGGGVNRAASALALGLLIGLLLGCPAAVKPGQSNEASKPQTVTITVTGDENVTVNAPNTLEVTKGSKWSGVRSKVEEKVSCKPGYEAKGFKLGSAIGADLQDNYIFNENKTVFVLSKPKGGSIQPSSITITVDADEGYTLVNGNSFTAENGALWKDLVRQAKDKVSLKDGYSALGFKMGSVYLDDDSVLTRDVNVRAVSKPDDGDPEPLKIIITIQADEGYTVKANNTVKCEQNTLWKDIKEAVQEKVELKTGYTALGWKLGGAYLEDSTLFTGNAVLTAVSKSAGASEPVHITITMQGDEGVEFAEGNSLTADKGAEWQSIRAIAEGKISFKNGSELAEWRLNNSGGQVLTDSYVFNGGETIFAVTKTSIFRTDGNGSIIGYTCAKEDLPETLVIPFKIGNEVITKITGYAFEECTRLKKIDLSVCTSLAEISTSAFEKCTGLTDINFSACTGISNIKYSAFNKCTGLKTIDLSRCTNLRVIGYAAFAECSSVTTLILPKNLTQIEEAAFHRCAGLTSLDLSSYEALNTIEDSAFFECTALTRVHLPQNLKNLNSRAFGFCTNLTSFTVDAANETYYSLDNVIYTKDMKSIVAAAGSLTNFIVPEGVTEIYNMAFLGCKNLKNIHLPQSLIDIYEKAFYASGLTSIDFSNCVNLTIIDEKLFMECEDLKTVILPPNLTIIGKQAFQLCKNLENVDFSHCKKPLLIGESSFPHCDRLVNLVLPQSLIAINNAAFAFCKGLKNVDFSACTSLEGIYGIAFWSCESLTKIDLSGCTSLTQIYDGAFKQCKNLTEVKLPENLTEIDRNLFENCTALSSINIPLTIKSLGAGAFERCKSLTGVLDLSAYTNLTKIDTSAFSGCTGFTGIVFAQNMTEINNEAFLNCTGLSGLLDLSVCANLTKIGEKTFKDCNNVIIKLPESIKEIGYEAFESCKNVIVPNDEIKEMVKASSYPEERIVLGSLHTEDGFFFEDEAKTILLGCEGTKTGAITIPSSTVTIFKKAFRGNLKLTFIDLSSCANLKTIGIAAFSGCKNAEIRLPQTINSIEAGAFGSKGYYGNDACKRVIVPTEAIKKKVTDSGYNGRVLVYAIIEDGFYFADLAKTKLSGCDGTKTGTLVIPQSTRAITENAFEGDLNITALDFSNCSNLAYIESEAFKGCASITSIDFSSRDAYIDIQGGAFAGCAGITSLNIHGCHTYDIGAFFSYCKNLTTITVDDSNSAYSCEENVLYSKDMKELILAAKNIGSISIKDGTTHIAHGAFRHCTHLTSITLPQSLTEIDGGAFSGCTGLTSIDLSGCARLKKIGWYAFGGCTDAEIKLPESITEIEGIAFGRNEDSYCKKVLIKSGADFERIKALVTGTPCNYPADRVEQY
ncbi:MAG: leucine-rich repeat protein [Treponema sp.]